MTQIKREIFRATLLATAAILTQAGLLFADPPGLKTLDIGAQAPAFNLPGVDGRQHRLKDFESARILVVLFTCNHCPTAQAYEERIAKLHAEYSKKGVALVAISPNDPKAVQLSELGYTDLSDSFTEMQLRAKTNRFEYPYLYDGETQQTARAYGVLATPHVFIFDEARKLRYVGRIDDAEVKTVKAHNARDAIEALLAGKPVLVEKTRVFGCSTKWADKREDAKRALERWDREPVKLDLIDVPELKKLARNDTKKLILINAWATWCGPCIAEMPELVTINRMYRQRPFHLITLSLDAPEKKDAALKILRENNVSTTNYLVQSTDKDEIAEAVDKDWPGPLPYTVLIAPGGKVLYRKTNAIDPLELKRAIVAYLGRTY
jgi:peroxiredoxin